MSFEIKQIKFHDFFDLGYQPKSFFEDKDISRYFFEYFQCEDRSYVVFYRGSPVLFFPAMYKDGKYHFTGVSLQLCFLTEDQNIRIDAIDILLKELLKDPNDTIYGRYCQELAHVGLKYNCSVKSRFMAHMDISPSMEDIRKGIRASYKSLINKGQRELTTRVDFGPDALASTMEAAKEFHIRISGRQTRPDSAWRVQHDLVVAKKAYHVVSYLNDKLVSSSYVFTDGREAYYGSGVYDRSLMREGMPLSHWNVYRAISFAKEELKLNKFILGEMGPDFPDKKFEDIVMFKRGFGKPELETTVVISSKPRDYSNPIS